MTVKVRIHAEGLIEQRIIRLLKIEASVLNPPHPTKVDLTTLHMYHEGTGTRVIFDGSLQLESILDIQGFLIVLHDSTVNVLELTRLTLEGVE